MKSSSDRVNALRERRRKEGLVKVELWVKPEYKPELKRIERTMREG